MSEPTVVIPPTSRAQLTSDAKELLEQLHLCAEKTADDADVIPNLLEVCTQIIESNFILPLLAMVQSVERDPRNDFAPSKDTCKENAEMADAALLLLSEMIQINIARLEQAGWGLIGEGEIAGSFIFEHEDGQTTSDPALPDQSWQLKLLHSLSLLISPSVSIDNNTDIVWAARVVSCPFFRLQINASNTTIDKNHLSVVDVLQTDDEGESVAVRGIFDKVWQGLYAEPIHQWDMSSAIGTQLQSWVDTTLIGLSVLSESCDILLIGTGNGALSSFLMKYLPQSKVSLLEPQKEFLEIASSYFGFDPKVINDITEIKKDQLNETLNSFHERNFRYGVIIVDLLMNTDNACQDLLAESLIHLEKILEVKTSATLLIKLGRYQNVTEVAKVLNQRFEHVELFTEYRLRDAKSTDDPDDVVALCRRNRSSALSVKSWQKSCLSMEFSSDTMDVASARDTQVIRKSKFFSLTEIESIHAAAATAGVRGAGIETRSEESDIWKVVFLQTNNLFLELLPNIHNKILSLAHEVSKQQGWWNSCENQLNVRVAEYHTMKKGGNLPDPKHYDLDSIVTVDIMLAAPGKDFQGGRFQTEESDGQISQHSFEQGDALLFCSHKAHCVGMVTEGTRNVLVVEIWKGPKRTCPHRCEKLGGTCPLEQLDVPPKKPKSGFPFRLGAVETPNRDQHLSVNKVLWEPTT